jgi:hypothetical protein
MKLRHRSALVLSALPFWAMAQPTAFTYQGRLKNGESPAAGLHDFRFRLWDAASTSNHLATAERTRL